MRFGLLGPVEAWDDERRPLAIGGQQQRALLALLVINANRVVAIDRLVAYLWGDDPPRRARSLAQGCVAQLRRALRSGRPDGSQPLLTRAPGYLLEVTPGGSDLDRFEELADAAGSADDPARARALLADALALWRGPALADIDLEECRNEAYRLEERRLAVLEQRIDADLSLGRHARLAGELSALVHEHPLRERLWAQLMLALHGADRQAEALAAYQRVREHLVEQLGVEPAESLQRVHRAILTGAGTVAVQRTPQRRPDPGLAQLPAAAAGFVGRAKPAQVAGPTAGPAPCRRRDRGHLRHRRRGQDHPGAALGAQGQDAVPRRQPLRQPA